MDFATRAYFKAAETEIEPSVTTQSTDNTWDTGTPESADLNVIRFIQTLRNAEVLPPSDHKMISYSGGEFEDHSMPLARAMRCIDQTDTYLCSQRLSELSSLSNTLISGCGFQGGAFQPKEAAEAALSVCNLGSEYLLKTGATTEKNKSVDALTALLEEQHMITLFQAGWKILFDDVVLHTAKAVLDFIHYFKKEVKSSEQTDEMTRMGNLLRFYILSGRPWEFSDQMDYLQMFIDGETTMAIAGLMQEFPTLSKVICAKGGHRWSPFIRSQSHIRTVQSFLTDALSCGR